MGSCKYSYLSMKSETSGYRRNNYIFDYCSIRENKDFCSVQAPSLSIQDQEPSFGLLYYQRHHFWPLKCPARPLNVTIAFCQQQTFEN